MKKIINFFKNIPSFIIESIPSELSPFLPKFLQKKKRFKDEDPFFVTPLDPTKTKEEKIKIEKRRRHQAYMALEYKLSMTTYYDFFSKDTFKISKFSKYLAQIVNKKIVTSDFLLLSFFYANLDICQSLKKYQITKETIGKLMSKIYVKIPTKTSEKNIYYLQRFLKNLISFFPINFQKQIPDPTIKYSLEVHKIFEKAAQNALVRFKTPVISTEILFITLMEEKKTKAAKFIEKCIADETNWYILRYILIKRLYKYESCIRREISKNQQYFAYLLKTQLSDIEFERLIDNNYLQFGVTRFRNRLIQQAVKTDIYDLIEEDIYNSIRANRNERKYSS